MRAVPSDFVALSSWMTREATQMACFIQEPEDPTQIDNLEETRDE